ncbi:MAG: hypothetical protein ACRYF3_00840 [Janthinobacterium lividum]
MNQHVVLATVVTHTEWQRCSDDVLRAVHAELREQTRQRGLLIVDPASEDVEVLPYGTRVRVTVSAEGVPLDQRP